MKIKILPYMHKCWSWGGFSQLCLTPAIYFTHSRNWNFMETGVYTDLWIISMNFLVWDFGIQIYNDLK